MKILVTGANGLVGQHLVQELVKHGHEVVGLARGQNRMKNFTHSSYQYFDVDITDAVKLEDVVKSTSPQLVIHCAAMTQVDQCEEDKQTCYNVNVSATRFLMDVCVDKKCWLILLSTDFVFDGINGPYDEQAQPAPVNYYGSTKVAAEKSIMEYKGDWTIVRTVLIYGQTVEGTRSNIITWVKTNLEKGERIKVVADQWRTPTYIGDLVKGILLIIDKKAKGLFHISGKDWLTPYDMAIATAKFFSLPENLIEKVDSSTFVQAGKRPLKTGFIITKAERELGYKPLSFEESLAVMYGKSH
jgi:dTDP-4-dehydrorhamnose reductase